MLAGAGGAKMLKTGGASEAPHLRAHSRRLSNGPYIAYNYMQNACL
jgi:hypothetical protein